MKKNIIMLFVFLLPLLSPLAIEAYHSAHVIVVSHYGFEKNYKPKQYVLFGLTKEGKLSTFGGLRDKGEYNPKDTAAREMFEESLGVLGNEKEIRKMLRGIEPSSGSKSGHISYVLPAAYYGKRVSYEFKKNRFDSWHPLPYSKREMVDIVAVRVEKIREKVLKNEKLEFKDNNGVIRPLRGAAAGAVKAAVIKGHL